jgi:MFS family permease
MWWFGLSKPQWMIVLSAFLGYTMDCADLTMFNLVQIPSMRELLGNVGIAKLREAGNTIISYKLMSWGVGGVLFGVLADKWSRSKTMMLTIGIYAVCTGASAFAPNYEVLKWLQIGSGLGIGGEYAAGAALVVEAMAPLSQRQRSYAMALIQSSFAAGFLLAALINLGVGALDLGPSGWRYVLGFGFLPALFIFFIRSKVSDPEISVRARGQGSVRDLFVDTEVRRSTAVGIGICLAMMIGSWGGLTLLPVWISELVSQSGGTPAEAVREVSGIFIIMMLSGFPAYFLVAWLGERTWMTRKNLYRVVCAAGMLASLYMFLVNKDLAGIRMFAPVYGMCVMGGFAVFGLILPDWFRTRNRAVGVGTSYNASRFLSGVGLFSLLTLARSLGTPYAAAAATSAYALGFIVIPFGKETKGKPLPS